MAVPGLSTSASATSPSACGGNASSWSSSATYARRDLQRRIGRGGDVTVDRAPHDANARVARGIAGQVSRDAGSVDASSAMHSSQFGYVCANTLSRHAASQRGDELYAGITSESRGAIRSPAMASRKAHEPRRTRLDRRDPASVPRLRIDAAQRPLDEPRLRAASTTSGRRTQAGHQSRVHRYSCA